MNSTIDNLVIGGGLAGSMVAIRLASAGRKVTLLEKERSAHHKVCGEFLSPEAVEYLRQAGVEPLDLGAATIRFLRMSSKRTVVEAALPFTARSLSRYALDESMLRSFVAADRCAQTPCFWPPANTIFAGGIGPPQVKLTSSAPVKPTLSASNCTGD